MLSIDTNLLLYAFSDAAPEQPAARAWFATVSDRDDVALSEFVLAEFYLLLRNPAVLARPLDAVAATAVVQTYRHHPRWKIVGFPPNSRRLHEALWHCASAADFPRRRLYDTRFALTLRAFGVTDFATANTRDFQAMGFERVWNPLLG